MTAPIIETVVIDNDNAAKINYMMTNANQFFIYNKATSKLDIVDYRYHVTIRRGQYIGEQISLVYKSDFPTFLPDPTFDPGTSAFYSPERDHRMDIRIEDGIGTYKFESRDETDVPTTIQNNEYSCPILSLRVQNISKDTVVFLIWTGRNWLITNHTRYIPSTLETGAFSIDGYCTAMGYPW